MNNKLSKYNEVFIYIIKEVLFSIFIAFLFFFFVFFINYIILIAQQILSKNAPLDDVIELMICFLPQIISLSLPFSALVGSLMALGRLSSDNEILAFRASGISLNKIFKPIFVISVFITLLSFFVNDYLLPLGFINSRIIQRRILYKLPTLELEPYRAKTYDDKVIVTGGIVGNLLLDVIIIDKTSDNKKRVINAKTARLLENSEELGVLSLELSEVSIHIADPKDAESYEYSTAKQMTFNILLTQFLQSTGPLNPTPYEMAFVDVLKEVRNKEIKLAERRMSQFERIQFAKYDLAMEIQYASQLGSLSRMMLNQRNSSIQRSYDAYLRETEKKVEDNSLRNYRVELYKKFSHPFSCVVFIIFAFPIGLMARKSGRIIGFGIGVLMSAFYWGMLFVSYRTGARVDFSPFLVIWAPNIIIGFIGAGLFFMRLKK
ncbi:MAG: LptF/LptG family permease [Spirochaetales bacterium]|nr:LptF/LptG family permease [Spirochaetales bacterium]